MTNENKKSPLALYDSATFMVSELASELFILSCAVTNEYTAPNGEDIATMLLGMAKKTENINDDINALYDTMREKRA